MLFFQGRSLAVFILIFKLSILFISTSVHAGISQYWNEFIFEHDIDETFAVETALEQQLVNHLSTFVLYNITIEPSYKFFDSSSIGVGYRFEREKDNGIWVTENRYWLHHAVKWQFVQSSIKLKSKVEFRDLENNNFWRFRSKIKFSHNMQAGSSEITPFLTFEPFYDFDVDEWNQIRTAVGLSFEVQEHIEISLYYLNMSKKNNNHWNDTNVLGTEIVFPY